MDTNPRSEVFVLGAGFSAAARHLPTTALLSKEILSEVGKSEFKPHIDEISSGIKEDFEVLLSFLFDRYPWTEEDEHHIRWAIYPRIVKSLCQRLRSGPGDYSEFIDPKKPSSDRWLSRFMDHILGNALTVITFNYDTVLEYFLAEAAKRAGKEDLQLNFYKTAISNALARRGEAVLGADQVSGARVIKLHGSINWFYDDQQRNTSPIWGLNSQNMNEQEELVGDLKPFIIPPLAQKTEFYHHSVVRHLWKQAKIAIEGAERIVFLGYSFPKADLPVTLFLQGIKTMTEKAVDIALIHSDKNELCGRITRLGMTKLDRVFITSEGDPIGDYLAARAIGLKSTDQ